MNLFEVPDSFYSHPEYPYTKHVDNIVACFNDTAHHDTAHFHDIGKLSKEFQDYINNRYGCKKTTHAMEGAILYLYSNDCKIDEKTFPIFLSILKHHGDLENINSLANETLSCESNFSRKYSNLARKIKYISKYLPGGINFALDEFIDIFDDEEFVNNNNLGGLSNYFKIKEIFSRLIFADKFEAIFHDSFLDNKVIQTEDCLKLLLEVIQKKSNALSSIRNQARNEVINNFRKNIDKNIFLIEAPTGIGKTYMALQLALEIVKEKNKNRVITALPMTSIIDQTHVEYSKVLGESNVLKFHHLTHSKKYIDADQENIDEKDLNRQKNDYLTSSWAFDKIIITTFNQLFNCFYSNKNDDLIKFWVLRNSVIILDEIQTIPRVLLKDVSQTISHVSRQFDIDFILMSATIPAIKNFFERETLCEILNAEKYFSMNFNNRYTLSYNKDIDTLDLLGENIKEKSKSFNSILCVVNTKKLSLELFKKLENFFKDEDIFLLNTNFIPLHRKMKIEGIHKRLKNKKRTILISTQIVEAGVDLDFDIGFREFAPFSSIIQSAGRINREGLNKNAKLIITNKIGNSPYCAKDLLYEEVTELLAEKIEEKNILSVLRKYFETIIRKTSPDTMLITDMESLEFEIVMKKFTDNFMQEIPSLSTIFIETESDLLKNFKDKREEVLKTLKNKEINLNQKMALKIKLKELNKDYSGYLINVPAKEANYYPEIWENSNIYYCPYDTVKNGDKYSFEKGWQSEFESFI
ncbi:MAG: CRISPR-associated helicase/endonuclease Cas3 [Candidatus Kuenenia stuttgartiensis]|nr:MAG: CRISPR-associated helicase/endonuclease Cas3 [Candidatus Kuenenia stuttgartiensis]